MDIQNFMNDTRILLPTYWTFLFGSFATVENTREIDDVYKKLTYWNSKTVLGPADDKFKITTTVSTFSSKDKLFGYPIRT